MSNLTSLTAKIYTDWGHPLRIFTGSVAQEMEEIPFYVSVRDFSENVGSSTIRRWGSASMPCPGSISVSNNILTNKQEPHYRCTAVPFTELRKLTNNTDMHPGNKDRANAIIKWLEPIYKEYAETIVKPIETGTEALTPKFSEITSQEKSENSSVQGQSPQIKSKYRALRESGMTASEALTAVLSEPEKRPRVACDSVVPVKPTRIHEQEKSEYRKLGSIVRESGMTPTEAVESVSAKVDTSESPIEPLGFTVDDVAKRLYELKKENESLKAEVDKLKKDLEDYRTIRDMFLSIGGD